MNINLRKEIYPGVDLEVDFVKTLLKKMKNCIKNKETNALSFHKNTFTA